MIPQPPIHRARRIPASLLVAVFGFLMALSSCGKESKPTKEFLEARAKEYWELRFHGDWKRIYAYVSPLERKYVSLQDFVEGRSTELSTTSYTIDSVKVQGTEGETVVKCKWRITLPQDVQRYREGESVVKDSWAYLEGDWFIRLNSPGPGVSK